MEYCAGPLATGAATEKPAFDLADRADEPSGRTVRMTGGIPPQPAGSPPCRDKSPGVAAPGWTKVLLPRSIDCCETPLLMGHYTQTSVGIRHTFRRHEMVTPCLPRILGRVYEKTSRAPAAVILVSAVPGRTTRAPSAPARSPFAYWRAHEAPVANARRARPGGTAHPAARTFGLTDDGPAEAHALPAIATHGVRAADPSARKGARPSDRCPQLQDSRHARAMAHPMSSATRGDCAANTLLGTSERNRA